MTTTTILLDPTDERSPDRRERLSRPKDLDGLIVGLLDISKARGDNLPERNRKTAHRARSQNQAVSKTDLCEISPH